ncbi:FAD-dependent oxidoreductase [Geodermatophilus sp. SYSU D00758]
MRALVIGGGVAGPVVAMALQRVGIEATVHEAYPAPAGDVGAWLGVQVNGLDALRAIDADGAVLDVGVPTPVIEFRSGTGRVLGAVPTAGPGPGAAPGVSAKRSDLYRALHGAALDRGIDIRYGSRLTGVVSTPDGVTATFADGSTASADLLVGADGVRSTVRALLDPGCPPPRYVPVLNTAGYADHTPPGAEVGRLTMVFGRRAFAGYLAAPTGQTWWFANPPLPVEPGPGEVAAIPDAAWRSRLLDLHRADRSPVVDLVEATPGPLRGWTTYDLPTVRRWHGGRVVLIGDAAHATSPAAGQGASLAVEDAVVLARCLRDLPVPQAFARFEELRRGRVERAVAQGFRTSSAKSPPAVGRVVRDLVMPVALRWAAARGSDPQAWFRAHRVDWDAPVGAG